MVQKVECCNRRYTPEQVYEIRDYKGYRVFYLMAFPPCKNCNKVQYGTKAIDYLDQETPFFLLDKRIKREYETLIRIGRAVPIEKPPEDAKDTRAKAAGVGEWTLRAKTGNVEYVLSHLMALKRLKCSASV